jgi:hypothetical protein
MERRPGAKAHWMIAFIEGAEAPCSLRKRTDEKEYSSAWREDLGLKPIG